MPPNDPPGSPAKIKGYHDIVIGSTVKASTGEKTTTASTKRTQKQVNTMSAAQKRVYDAKSADRVDVSRFRKRMTESNKAVVAYLKYLRKNDGPLYFDVLGTLKVQAQNACYVKRATAGSLWMQVVPDDGTVEIPSIESVFKPQDTVYDVGDPTLMPPDAITQAANTRYKIHHSNRHLIEKGSKTKFTASPVIKLDQAKMLEEHQDETQDEIVSSGMWDITRDFWTSAMSSAMIKYTAVDEISWKEYVEDIMDFETFARYAVYTSKMTMEAFRDTFGNPWDLNVEPASRFEYIKSVMKASMVTHQFFDDTGTVALPAFPLLFAKAERIMLGLIATIQAEGGWTTLSAFKLKDHEGVDYMLPGPFKQTKHTLESYPTNFPMFYFTTQDAMVMMIALLTPHNVRPADIGPYMALHDSVTPDDSRNLDTVVQDIDMEYFQELAESGDGDDEVPEDNNGQRDLINFDIDDMVEGETSQDYLKRQLGALKSGSAG